MKKERGRPTGTGNNPFQLPTTLVGWCLFTCARYVRSSHSACRVSVHSGGSFRKNIFAFANFLSVKTRKVLKIAEKRGTI